MILPKKKWIEKKQEWVLDSEGIAQTAKIIHEALDFFERMDRSNMDEGEDAIFGIHKKRLKELCNYLEKKQ